MSDVDELVALFERVEGEVGQDPQRELRINRGHADELYEDFAKAVVEAAVSERAALLERVEALEQERDRLKLEVFMYETFRKVVHDFPGLPAGAIDLSTKLAEAHTALAAHEAHEPQGGSADG